jgi:uncharacterized membrane protein YtjA (UPF0391 family)
MMFPDFRRLAVEARDRSGPGIVITINERASMPDADYSRSVRPDRRAPHFVRSVAACPPSAGVHPILAFAPTEQILHRQGIARLAKLLNTGEIYGGTWIATFNAERRLASMLGPNGQAPSRLNSDKEISMLNWAVIFLVIAVVAAIFGFSGVAGAAANIAWILAVVGIVLAVAFFVMGRRPPLP